MGNSSSSTKKKDITYIDEDPTHSFKEGIAREHSTGQSPFKYYERIGELGSGSMGAVMKVEKKPEKIEKIVNRTSRRASFTTAMKMPAKRTTFFIPKSRSSNNLSSSLNSRFKAPQKPKLYAMKRIILERMTDEFVNELRNEIAILRDLDHPNIVRLYEVYDTKSQIYMVMELCSGGDLWKRVPYTEVDAAKIVKKMVSAVAHMHEQGICHRDLKMENILFENDSPEAEIKVIDFGLSQKFSPGEQMKSRVGSFYTMAPQVLQGEYTSKADMWSLGVLAYIVLCGEKPFEAPERDDVIARIMRCDFHFDHEAWKTISDEAKEFIKDLIEIDPDGRLSAHQANETEWLQKQESESTLEKELIDLIHRTLLYQSEGSLMKKIALLIIAHHSSNEEIRELRNAFRQYDSNNDGIITFDDFKTTLGNFGYREEDCKFLFEKLDVYQKNQVYYTEFLAATIESQGIIDEQKLAHAFNRITCEKGYINHKNIRQLLGVDYNYDLVEKAFKEADRDADGKISYHEFKISFGREKRSSQMSLRTSRYLDDTGYDVTYDSEDRECHPDEKELGPEEKHETKSPYLANEVELSLK